MTTYRESHNAAAMRSGQAAYDNACPPDDPPERDEDDDNTCRLCGIEMERFKRHRCPEEDCP